MVFIISLMAGNMMPGPAANTSLTLIIHCCQLWINNNPVIQHCKYYSESFKKTLRWKHILMTLLIHWNKFNWRSFRSLLFPNLYWKSFAKFYVIFSAWVSSNHWISSTIGPKDHVYRMVKERYSNIWPNQTIVSDQSELTILLCQPINCLLLMKPTLPWYSSLQLLPSYIHDPWVVMILIFLET